MIQSKNSPLSNILIIYTFTTLFLGKSVLQKFGFDLGNEGIIANCHYISFPILIFTFIIKYKYLHFIKREKKFILLSVCYLFGIIVFLNRSANISFIINNVIEPILLISILRETNIKTIKYIKNLIILFFITESFVAIYESLTQTIVFAKVDNFNTSLVNFDMRAYSLHGHPLQNAFIVSIISTLILSCSNKGIIFRYSLFFLGYIAVFSFNTRSSILFLGLILFVNVFRDIFYSKIKKKQKISITIILVMLIPIVINFIVNNNLGSRLSRQMDSNDDSSMARFILLTIFGELTFNEVLFGSERSLFFQNKYRLVAIENSIMNTIFYYGIIYTIILYYVLYKELKNINIPKFSFLITIIIFFLLINTNNALATSCPVIPITILTMYSFYKSHF